MEDLYGGDFVNLEEHDGVQVVHHEGQGGEGEEGGG